MPEPPRRKRLQIHLSTALILMLAAGGLIWANVVPRQIYNNDKTGAWTQEEENIGSKQFDTIVGDERDTGRRLQDAEFNIVRYGFPLTIVRRVSAMITFKHGVNAQSRTDTIVDWPPIAINLAVALGILFTIWFMCEWWTRRREAKTMRD